MTRPLRSTPITGASPLLRAGPPAEPATVLTPTQRRLLPLAHPETRTSSIGFGLLPFHAEAADRARVASMPDTAWPVNGHPPSSSRDPVDTPVSMSPVYISTRQQRFARARLPDPHLTRHARLSHIAHHGRDTTPAACGGLKPPPAGRLRRANNPSSPAQHRFTKLYLHRTPFHVRDTPTDRVTNSSTDLVNLSVAKRKSGGGGERGSFPVSACAATRKRSRRSRTPPPLRPDHRASSSYCAAASAAPAVVATAKSGTAMGLLNGIIAPGASIGVIAPSFLGMDWRSGNIRCCDIHRLIPLGVSFGYWSVLRGRVASSAGLEGSCPRIVTTRLRPVLH